MGGWMNCCKKHLELMEEDIKKRGLFFNGYADGDRRNRCDFPNCKERADFEVFWGKPTGMI